MEHYMSGGRCSPTAGGQRRYQDEEDEFFSEEDAETVEIIKDLIETRVRLRSPMTAVTSPSAASRTGSSSQHEGRMFGLPSSTATLQHGIQNLLKHFVRTWSKSADVKNGRMANGE